MAHVQYRILASSHFMSLSLLSLQDGAMARQPSHLTTKINKEFLARIAKARKVGGGNS